MVTFYRLYSLMSLITTLFTMDNSYLETIFADRIGGKNFGKIDQLYKFAKIKRAKALAVKAKPGIPLIDMGVGEPDEMAHSAIVKTLAAEAKKTENRGYADNGCLEFRQAAARYMKKLFKVTLNPETQILHSIGSKPALAMLPKCFINPGDVTLMTTPGYPVFGTHAQYLGGEVYNIPLLSENGYFPDLESIPAAILKRAKVLVLNYPNNPTGTVATKRFFQTVVDWAKANKLIVIQDAAYSALNYKNQYVSILAAKGAKDICLEVHSLSKSFNMTGWRMAWVCGNEQLLAAYSEMKSNIDSGQFLGIQKAAAYALDHPEITEEIIAKYSRRMDLLVEALKSLGFPVKKSAGTFFLYTSAPKAAIHDGKKMLFNSAEVFSHWMIYEQLISTVPWDDTSERGVRFSVTFAAKGLKEEKAVIKEIQRRLAGYEFVF